MSASPSSLLAHRPSLWDIATWLSTWSETRFSWTKSEPSSTMLSLSHSRQRILVNQLSVPLMRLTMKLCSLSASTASVSRNPSELSLLSCIHHPRLSLKTPWSKGFYSRRMISSTLIIMLSTMILTNGLSLTLTSLKDLILRVSTTSSLMDRRDTQWATCPSLEANESVWERLSLRICQRL
mgnify:CR=1 FL=1